MKTNDEIRYPEVRLVGDNVTPGIYSSREAQRMAGDLGLDLVEVSADAKPPVCKIMDVTKFLYEKKKKEKAQNKPKKLKEIQLTSNTQQHDLETKARHAVGFLKDGHKVKVSVLFKGRNIEFVDRGKLLLLNFISLTAEAGTAESLPTMEGKRMRVFLAPKK